MHEQLYHPIIYFEIFHGGWKHCGQYFHKMAQDCSIINQVNRNVKLCWFMHSNFQVAYVAKLIVDSFSSSLNINTTWRWWLQFPPDDVTTIKFNARTIVIQTDVESATFRRRNMHSLKTPPFSDVEVFQRTISDLMHAARCLSINRCVFSFKRLIFYVGKFNFTEHHSLWSWQNGKLYKIN